MWKTNIQQRMKSQETTKQMPLLLKSEIMQGFKSNTFSLDYQSLYCVAFGHYATHLIAQVELIKTVKTLGRTYPANQKLSHQCGESLN